MPHSFTSGPWSFMQSSVAGRYIVSAENTPLDICVLSNRNKSHDEIQENARLIASAPDLLKQRDELLEALRELIRLVPVPKAADGIIGGRAAYQQALDNAAAAIAEAEDAV